MKDILLTVAFWIGITAFACGGWLSLKASISYAARTRDFFSFFISGGLHNWKNFSDEEKGDWKKVFAMMPICFVCISISLYIGTNNFNNDDLSLLRSSIALLFPQ